MRNSISLVLLCILVTFATSAKSQMLDEQILEKIFPVEDWVSYQSSIETKKASELNLKKADETFSKVANLKIEAAKQTKERKKKKMLEEADLLNSEGKKTAIRALSSFKEVNKNKIELLQLNFDKQKIESYQISIDKIKKENDQFKSDLSLKRKTINNLTTEEKYKMLLLVDSIENLEIQNYLKMFVINSKYENYKQYTNEVVFDSKPSNSQDDPLDDKKRFKAKTQADSLLNFGADDNKLEFFVESEVNKTVDDKKIDTNKSDNAGLESLILEMDVNNNKETSNSTALAMKNESKKEEKIETSKDTVVNHDRYGPKNLNPGTDVVIKVNAQTPVNKIIFRVQITTNASELSPQKLRNVYRACNVYYQTSQNNYFKYAVGEFDTYEAAAKEKKDSDVKGAFVVAFLNNNSMDVKEAIAQLKQK